YRARPIRALHSFPTRRSSDLRAARQASPSYGHLPLIVLSQDYSQDRSPQGEQMAATWDALQHDLASLSSNSRQSVAAHSGHYIQDRKSTRLNSSHLVISYAVF